MLLGARQFFERRGAALPYDAEVEYLESTGTQWIDTGITPSAATECNIDLMFTGETIQQFGTGRKLSSKWAVLLGYYQYGQYGISFWAGVNQTTRRSTHIVNERVLCGFSIPNGTYWLGGNPTADANLTAPTTDCPTFALFARKNATNDLSGYCTMRVFSAEINGVEGVRDFVPVRFTNELGQSEGAMYDRANPTFGMNPDGSPRTDGLYRNRGTGAFTWAEK